VEIAHYFFITICAASDSGEMEVNMKSLLSFYGDSINQDEIFSKMYLKYRVEKEDFKHLDFALILFNQEKIDMLKYDYAEIMYNQLTEQICIDFYKEEDGENEDVIYIETLWTRGEFFKVISKIEE
jgi:hypothetical protein